MKVTRLVQRVPAFEEAPADKTGPSLSLRSCGHGTARVPEKLIRQHLTRVLTSSTFDPVDRLKRFISFIVHESLAGRGSELKEYTIGVHVFDKEPLFDPRTDSIVRVQARRLRARLARYYDEEGQDDEVIIDLRKGGYVPGFRRREERAHVRPSAGTALVGRDTIAVLPFADRSAGATLDGFCRGLRDEIVHALTAQGTLRVLGSRDEGAGAPPSWTVTGAALIISGSVREAGERVRVTTHLLDGTSNCYVWSEATDAALADPIAIQEAVARAVVARLSSRTRT